MASDGAQFLKSVHWQPRYSGETGDPLRDFYIPALSRSVAYDRKAGFFSSTALGVAAEGVTRLVANGGTMRLLVGCQLSQDDVEVIGSAYKKREELQGLVERRLLETLLQPTDGIQRDRLSLLSWMIVQGKLDIKVAVPQDEYGTLLSPERAEGIFHEKVGIFTDAEGDRLVFSGSINETAAAWLKNVESFHVYRSWGADAGHAEAEVQEFSLLWENKGRRSTVLEFPEAVRNRLIEIAPPEVTDKDPAERDRDRPTLKGEAEKWAFQFLRDAPHLMVDGQDPLEPVFRLAAATSAVRPWPNQEKTALDAIRRYPQRFLFCDEVGLGKTIEAGLVLRTLLLRGMVKRCLILVPGGLVKQWQEELIEKFNLDIPRFTGGAFVDARGREWVPEDENPWASKDVFIASSHLAKRRGRQERVLAAPEWDLIIVDEAHHARRSAPTREEEYRPNHLLRLLRELRKKTNGMLLLTATPMQIDVVELWDLLVLLGMGGKWGAPHGDNLKDYFRELRLWPAGNEAFLFGMVRDYLQNGGHLDPKLDEQARESVGPVFWQRLLNAAREGGVPPRAGGDRTKLAFCQQFFSRHTPLRRFMQRSTRDLLRRYREKGLIRENVPGRAVQDRFVPFRRPEEKELYERLEEYIGDYWRKAERESNAGLGFVMAIYRRRLTSSLYAVRRSLERRLADLQAGVASSCAGLTGEDLEDADILDTDIAEDMGAAGARISGDVRQEMEYLRRFIHDLNTAAYDSKFEQLVSDLNDQLRRHSKVIVFTQYTDTMDYLREQLVKVYGQQLACYSGRGGEYWDGDAWRGTSKEAIKNRFAVADDLKILLCTDAASEGLNLQTCGLLINWDAPWNPMKVEQRIGRLDRIGQLFREVTVINYFYEESIEATIYKRLGERIDWFQVAVGKLQPVLARLPSAIEQAAKAGREARAKTLETVIAELETQLDAMEAEGLDVDECVEQELPISGPLPGASVTAQDIEAIFTGSVFLRESVGMRQLEGKLHELRWNRELVTVTFDPDTYDTHAGSVRYLTYGEPLFEELLRRAPQPDLDDVDGPILRSMAGRLPTVRYDWFGDGNEWNENIKDVRRMLELLQAEGTGADVAVPAVERQRVTSLLGACAERLLNRVAEQRGARLQGELATLRAQAEGVLWDRVALDLARRPEGAPDDDRELVADAQGLLQTQLDARVQPYPPLLRLIGKPAGELDPPVRRLKRHFGEKPESIAARLGRVTRRANELFAAYKEASSH